MADICWNLQNGNLFIERKIGMKLMKEKTCACWKLHGNTVRTEITADITTFTATACIRMVNAGA